ncbi:MAG: tetratricopeptide repeat protein [Polyangiales bacterium]
MTDPKTPSDADRWDAVADAVELLHEDRYDDAITALREVLRADPGNDHAHFHLGVAFMRKEAAGPALAAFANAARLKPEHLGATVYQAWCLYELGRFADAIAMGQRALGLRADDGDALHVLGLASAELGHRDQAIEYLSRFVNTNPSAEDRFDAEALLAALKGSARPIDAN